MAGHHRGSIARHRRPSALRSAGAAARGRAAYAAGVIMLGAAFGLTAAAPEGRPAADQRSATTAAEASPPRPQPSVAARGQHRATPVVVDTKIPLGQAPKASPSPSPSPSPPPPPAAPPPPPTDAPEDCDSYSGNRLIACAMLADYGFGVDQMPALDNLWTRESGWNELAQNPSSGAYGIPQALPGDKMASCGDDWRTNPATQICWGLGYIKDRYGNPDGAWAHFQSRGWY